MGMPSTCKVVVVLCEQAQVCTCTLVVVDTIQYRATGSFSAYPGIRAVWNVADPRIFSGTCRNQNNTYTKGIRGWGYVIQTGENCWICLDAFTQYAFSSISFPFQLSTAQSPSQVFNPKSTPAIMWSGNCPFFYGGLSIPVLLAY